MIGYHYTTQQNWEKIQKHGLRPYEITNHEIGAIIGRSLWGVWVYRRRPLNTNHIGNVLRIVAIHKSTKVVLLEVTYNQEDCLRWKGQKLHILHDGTLGNLAYHRDFPATILANTISPENIKCLGEYDFEAFLGA